MNDSNNKVVVVTGCSRGLGLAIARNLAAAGYTVIAANRKKSLELETLIKDYKTQDTKLGRVNFCPLDLSKPESFHRFSRELKKEFGSPYGLVNNAATAHDGVLATLHDRDIDELIAVNLTGTILFTKYILRTMLGATAGRIVMVSSIIASTGFSGLSVYGATKAGLLGFMRSLAREIGRLDITVNAVSPGYMPTQMSAGLNEEKLERIRRRSPMNCLVEPNDVAATIRYLLSPEAARVTGIDMTIDAGSSI